MIQKIIVLFKTHLDIGYTDFSENVTARYLTSYIPKAMECARALRGQKQRFIWTTGSWLIDLFLKEAPPEQKAQMEDAIAHGEIAWHGLPFTTHSELMTEDLFDFGLSISQKLDRTYGVRTIGAKMTDVPGHTIGIVPHLAKAGIRFLHIGTNPACPAPEVPHLCRWRACDPDHPGKYEEIILMYDDCYGDLTEIPGTDTAILFAHTNDNLGPQTKDEVLALYAALREKYPGAEITAGTLNDAAEIALRAENLPVYTGEIGDTWIQGAATDPKKVSRYRFLLRSCAALSEDDRAEVFRHLIMVPEHTWGLNGVLNLGDTPYDRPGFEKARNAGAYDRLERSWEEQRAYVTRAEAVYTEKTGLPCEVPDTAFPDFEAQGYTLREDSSTAPFSVGGYTVQFDANGALCSLSSEKRQLADTAHPIGTFLYQKFSCGDFETFLKDYPSRPLPFIYDDMGKKGMEAVNPPASLTPPLLQKLYVRETSCAAVCAYPGEDFLRFGAPEQIAVVYDFFPSEIKVRLYWHSKPANRLPEALWFCLRPLDSGLQLSKMGRRIDPESAAMKGGRRLHAVDRGVFYQHTAIETLDCAVVNVGRPSLLTFRKEPVPTEDGVSFLLFNNVWNTNFPFWYDEDALFRFRILL